jgi:hypothetical protein
MSAKNFLLVYSSTGVTIENDSGKKSKVKTRLARLKCCSSYGLAQMIGKLQRRSSMQCYDGAMQLSAVSVSRLRSAFGVQAGTSSWMRLEMEMVM